MTWQMFFSTDPATLANWATEGLGALPTIHEKEGEPLPEAFEERLSQLPDRCRDMLELKFLKGKTQGDIAAMFGLAQPSVSYQIQRAIQRLQYLLTLPPDEEVEESLKTFFKKEKETLKVMISMYYTTSQSETGRVLKECQSHARTHFLLGLKKMEKAGHEYAWVFRRIKDSPGLRGPDRWEKRYVLD